MPLLGETNVSVSSTSMRQHHHIFLKKPFFFNAKTLNKLSDFFGEKREINRFCCFIFHTGVFCVRFLFDFDQYQVNFHRSMGGSATKDSKKYHLKKYNKTPKSIKKL